MAIGSNVGRSPIEGLAGTPTRVQDTVVIVPAYGEEQGIGIVLRELFDTVHATVLVVNRPNGDRTGAVARGQGALVIDQVGKGKGAAFRQGLQFVDQELPHTRFVGMVDADCTYPASALTDMRTILESEPGVGMVIARRITIYKNGATSKLFSLGNRVLATAHRVLNKVALRDPLSGLRLIRADVLDGWLPAADGFDVECELNCFVRNVRHLGIAEIPVQYRQRVGKKKLGFRHGFQILRRMVSLGTTGIASIPSAPAAARDTSRSTYAVRGAAARQCNPASSVMARLSDKPDPVGSPEAPIRNG